MSYITEEIKKGIKIHYIETKKFKTNLLAFFITMPLSRKTVTANALIPAVLKQGTEQQNTQEEINKELENMYGAEFNCGIDKTGDNHVIKFYIEALNDNYIENKSNLLQKSIQLLCEIVLNPYLEDDGFKEEYIKIEKNNIQKLIESKIDNKDQYSLNRCIEEMYKDKEYGLYKYGYIEDLENLGAKNLYKYYKELINTAKIDIFISGDINIEETKNIFKENEQINRLIAREDNHIINNEQTEIKQKVEISTIEEKRDVTQGKLVIGLDINCNKANSKYIVSLYNVILGESATSKLFQNVREKASLAYSARSNYVRQKNNIYIRCGIEIQNYEQAIKIIKEQLEDMKNGKFSDEDIQNAKKYMESGVKNVIDEQDSEITYYIGQELSGTFASFEEYINKINLVTKNQIQEIANKIEINTIYFLKNK